MPDTNKYPSKNQLLTIKWLAFLWGVLSIAMLWSAIIAHNFVQVHIFSEKVPVQDIAGINPITLGMVLVLCEIISTISGLLSALFGLTSIMLFVKRKWGFWCSYLSCSVLIVISGFLVCIDIAIKSFPFLSFVGLPGLGVSSFIVYCLVEIYSIPRNLSK
jgi:hypothetical protein